MKEIFSYENFLSINENRSEINFQKNEYVLKQGTFVSQLIFLKKGILKIVLEGKDEKNTILNIIEERSFVALPILENSNVYPFSVITISECEICFIRKETLQDVMKRNIEANSFLLKWYSDDYLFMYNKMAMLSSCNSHGKLASALLYLTSDHFNNDILNIISRKELAEFAAVSVESSNKILVQLKHDKIIDINKKGIEIKRRDLIEKLSAVG
jgi:CRP/FNR family transcriptional regulator